MKYNIIEFYVNFLEREYLKFFQIILKSKYDKKTCKPFIDRYIEVRYYNETNYTKEKDFLNRLNKELLDVYNSFKAEDLDFLKNIVALFGYIVYFDGVFDLIEMGELINTLIEDTDIKIKHNPETKEELKKWYINLQNSKEKFQKAINSKEFYLQEKSLYRKTYQLELKHNVKISNLYSEYAIEKSFNSGVIYEDKLFVTYVMASLIALNNAINLDFSRHYLVDLPNHFFLKEKKSNRLFQILNNTLAKKQIIIKILYKDYNDNKDKINNMIRDGYSFGLIIDSTFDIENIQEFILFPYIFVYEDHEFFDMIISEKDNISSKIVKL